MPTFEQLFDAIKLERISELERRIGIILPTEFKNFLECQNGGIPSPNELVIPKTDEKVLLDLLYGIAPSWQPADLETEYREVLAEVGNRFIPIGHDPGNNYFLLAVSGAHTGKIYYWDACRDFDSSSDSQNTYFVANDINELLHLLK